MDVNKNSYTFGFAAVLVVLVAVLLSVTAVSLKPLQQENIRLEKMTNLLQSIKVEATFEDAQKKYDTYFQNTVVLDSKGGLVSGADAFSMDFAAEMKKPATERTYPLFIADIDGSAYYVMPVRGNGLWGPIWGYIALQDDFNTIFGAVFDHKTETPGLGAEINTPKFEDQFIGKRIMGPSGEFKSVSVVKGTASTDYEVNGISGGTVTSVGVQNMLENGIEPYLPYFQGMKTAAL